MTDADLEEIRRGRLAELQKQGSVGGSQDDERKQQENDARASIIAQILTPEAADRLGRIRLVKESRATDVENRLIMLAKSGQLRSKVSEDQLKELLGAIAVDEEKKGGSGGGGKLVIERRKNNWEDDEDDFDL